jgi:signal transduction histidine kinase
LDGVERVAEIVRAIKEFSHPGPLEKTPLNLNRAIESTVLVCRNEWKYVADLILNLDPDLPLILCVAGDFNQVILNLTVNAAHAIGDVVAAAPGTKGRIEISTQRNGEWAEIRVMDTGAGIPEDVRPSIFNPFFTTKAVGKGTGQGLAIAHNVVVQKHGGAITFETEIGVGTTFLVRLPMGADAAESAEGEALTAQPARDNT